ncbi:uncharacterized protein DUF3857 [Chitinophaga niastensis]|uniref:Uncharacterized protein DUF3857 n=1 Tax=Chitinophaga niastensis TaxID=536980 RepID=A0A2P8H8U9_CHINA|nr:DUF3857 domain-containing protein [Chitinophaga niastensis]PSL42621.1 uncharacterized protein DUF3857 [Chitinophaga niastensis]
MKNLLFSLAVAAIAALPLHIQAQVNSYFPEIWKEKPQLHTMPQTENPYTVLDYRIVRDFNVTNRDKADAFSHYKTIYKNVRINTQAGADSLTQLVLSLEKAETLRGLRLRMLAPNGQITDLNDQVRLVQLSDDRKAIVVHNLVLQPGCELEYELSMKIYLDYAGSEYLQSNIAAEKVNFTLIAPKELQFRFNSMNGAPAISDSIRGNNHYYSVNMSQVPSLRSNDLCFYMPQLKRVDFALHKAVDNKDTINVTWQQFGEDNYVPFVAVSKAEYKQLEKELDKWPFVKQRLPVSQMIYLVEHYIKTNYELTAPSETGETADLISIIRYKRAEKAGYVRLLTAAYYILNIPTQMLFTSARDTILMDSNLVNRPLASNLLLYFPTVQQALAPTEMNTRFPCYPPAWANIPALRCRDTLVGEESKVLTDFITTPTPPYTLSNITTEATLSSVTAPVWQVTQSFGGYPGENVKTAFTTTGSTPEGRNSVYNAILPFAPGVRKPIVIKTDNETFTPRMLDKPVVVTSTLQTPTIVEHKGTQLNLHIGSLLGGTTQTNIPLPAEPLPVQITFPYYQEKRIHIDIPAGYKVANKADFSADISDKSTSQPALGFKMRCEQDGNHLHIFLIEWYRQTDFTGESKKVFGQLLNRINTLQQQQLVLVKE